MRERFWIKLQLDYESVNARKKLGVKLDKIQPYEQRVMT